MDEYFAYVIVYMMAYRVLTGVDSCTMNHDPMNSSFSSQFSRKIAAFFALLALGAGLAPAVRGDEPPSKFHALFNLDFSDKYLTPRGMIVQDHGLTIQALLLGLVDLYHDASPEAFTNDVSLTVGFWNDYATSPLAVHTTPASRKSAWVEIDPILGITIGFAKKFKLDVTYTEFAMQVLDIGTSQHLETKLSYDDSAELGAYSLHPYISYWKELTNKATAAANFGIPSSYYFEAGIAPGKSFGSVKVEAPIRVLLPNHNFYGEKFASSSTVGLWEAGLKGTMAANFMPAGYGHWNAHLGVKYMKFVDKNLQQLSTSGGFGGRTKDTWQVYAGMMSFF